MIKKNGLFVAAKMGVKYIRHIDIIMQKHLGALSAKKHHGKTNQDIGRKCRRKKVFTESGALLKNIKQKISANRRAPAVLNQYSPEMAFRLAGSFTFLA